MKVLTTLVGVNEAIELLASNFRRLVGLSVETVDTFKALGMALAEDVYATMDRPEEDISAVDGYAVNSLDTVGASYYNPLELTVKYVPKLSDSRVVACIEPGMAIRVHTGSPIPCNADAVVMLEDVSIKGDKVIIYRPIARGSNIVFRGEDFKKGELLATKGTIIKPPLVAALAANGISKVKVYRRINVSVMAVGNELVEPGENKEPDHVYNSSAYIVLSMLAKDQMFNLKYVGIVPDGVEEIGNAVLREFERGADIVITTGGTGVSEFDVIADFVEKYGKFVFRGVRMRPGRPTSSSIVNGNILVHLSGFPVATWAGYEVLLRAAVIRWLGLQGLDRRVIYARLSRRMPNVVGYTSIVRVHVSEREGDFYAEPYALRGSGVLSSLLRTNGYIVLPENVEGLEENDRVKVYVYD